MWKITNIEIALYTNILEKVNGFPDQNLRFENKSFSRPGSQIRNKLVTRPESS